MKNIMTLLMLLVCVLHQADVKAGIIRKIYNNNKNKNNAVTVERTTRQPLQPAQSPSSPPARQGRSVFVPPVAQQTASRAPSGTDIVASEDTYQQCKATTLPSFINNSAGWSNKYNRSGFKSIYNSFKALSPPAVLVTSAGNDHPQSITPVKAKASRDFDAIIVGSLASSGERSGFSQQGSEVHIMAPSDAYITSSNDNEEYRRFGGTSGATPLVTGSLAGFEWLSGYHPTPAEAKVLLKKTAIKTMYSDDTPQQNGVGMVNAYKLAMTGKRLKEQCGQDVACFKRAIESDSTYVFARDRGLAAEVDRAFPECSRTACHTSSANPAACINKANVLKKLRKEAFLHPSDKELWRKVACVYASGDFDSNSEGILSIYKALSGKYGDPLFCRTNADCTLSPPAGSCSAAAGSLVGMNTTMAEYYSIQCMQKTGRNVLCNNKCRCSNTENIKELFNNVVRQGQVRSRCVNSRCVMMGGITGQQQVPEDALDAPSVVPGTKSVR